MFLKVHFLKNFLDKSIGLLNAEQVNSVYFKTRFGIHTFGMKFPIDVIILDKNNNVVKLAENLKSNKIFLWNPRFNKVIELPKGEIKNNKIKLGDRIKLEIV